MTSDGRFQRRAAFAEQDGVRTWTGVDAVTGLPVLIYDTSERPLAEAEDLESEHIPGVLGSAFDGARGELVTAFSSQVRALETDDIDDAVVAAAATALRDAADEGVVHGDLRPGRFLVASGLLLVEGYGVRWRPKDARFAAPEGEASLAADVYAFAASFLDLGRDRIASETVALLVRATADEPAARPAAGDLAGELRRIAGSAPVGGLDPRSRVTPRDADEPRARPTGPDTGLPSARRASADRSAARRRPADRGADAAAVPMDPEPLVIESDPGGPPLRTSRGSGSFSKEPPPGTRYRAGDDAPAPPPGRFKFPSLHDGKILGSGPRRWYRFVVLGLTLVLAAVLAVLALSRQSARLVDSTAQSSVMYVIEVAVQPPNLPPVALHVVESPGGSALLPGTQLATVPGRVVLDQPGTWRLQGRFQERRSQVVTLQLPEQRALTLDFATPATRDAP